MIKLNNRAPPFAAAAINPRAILSSQSIVGLQLERAVKLSQRVLVLAMAEIKE